MDLSRYNYVIPSKEGILGSSFKLLNRAISILLIVFFVSCKLSPDRYIKNFNSGGALGTSYSITYLSDTKLDFQKEIDSVFKAVNQSLSTYIPTSDISKINQGNSEIIVDQMFQEVFTLSKEVHSKTDGYFDPTVGVLVNAWGFGPGQKVEMDSSKVDSLLNLVGFDKVQLNEKRQVLKRSPNIYIDFNAIAKGYAIDRLARMMDKKGIENYLLEVGGELVGKGENQIKGKPWVVGIDDPQIEQGRKLKILVELKNRAMASSGNYRKFRIDSISGKKFVHTIDPKTGYPKNASTLGVTVFANSCAKADAYATAFMAMELDKTIKFLSEQNELEAYVIYLDGNGEAKEYMTKGFKEAILD